MSIEIGDLIFIFIGSSALGISFIWNEFYKQTYQTLGSVFVPTNKPLSFLIYSSIVTIFVITLIILLTYAFLDKEESEDMTKKQSQMDKFRKRHGNKNVVKRNGFNPWK